MLPINTPISSPSKHNRHFRKAVACIGLKLELCRHWAGYFEDFRPGFGFWHICHVDRQGDFTLKQLRLSLVNETHTKPYTGPTLHLNECAQEASRVVNTKNFLPLFCYSRFKLLTLHCNTPNFANSLWKFEISFQNSQACL